jgi:hypothetical protein
LVGVFILKDYTMSELIGRDNEIDLIKSYINKMKSFHIYGPEGAGKTAILESIYQNWADMNTSLIPIFCRTSKTLKEILLHVAGFLLQRSRSLENIDKFKRIKQIYRQSDLKEVNSRDLKNMIFNNIGYKKFCIMLDHLDCVTPRINTFLTPLKSRAVTITASRQSWDIADYLFSARLDYCLWLLPKVKINNLSRHDALLLIEQIAGDTFTLGETLISEIYCITNGNPCMTKKILAKVFLPKYLIDGHVNLKLIGIDLKMERAGGKGH